MVDLRPVVKSDKETIFKWRNTPFVYSAGFSRRPVSELEHDGWFEWLRLDSHTAAYIIKKDEHDAGLVFFKYDAAFIDAEISIYLAEEYAGKGIGTEAIKAAVARESHGPAFTFTARFLPWNERSKKAFAKAGFSPCEDGAMVYKNPYESCN